MTYILLHCISWYGRISEYLPLPRFTDGIVLLQANGPYERDQWFHSLLWKFSILNSKKALKMTSCPEIIAKELKSLVNIAIKSQLHDPQVWTDCLVLISDQLNVSTCPQLPGSPSYLVPLVTWFP